MDPSGRHPQRVATAGAWVLVAACIAGALLAYRNEVDGLDGTSEWPREIGAALVGLSIAVLALLAMTPALAVLLRARRRTLASDDSWVGILMAAAATGVGTALVAVDQASGMVLRGWLLPAAWLAALGGAACLGILLGRLAFFPPRPASA